LDRAQTERRSERSEKFASEKRSCNQNNDYDAHVQVYMSISSSFLVTFLFQSYSYRFRFGNEGLLARVLSLLKIANRGIISFPENLQVIFFEKDRSGLTALHHAVRSGNKFVVRWCMQRTALAMPGHYDLEDVEEPLEGLEEDEKRFNLKSLIPDGASQQTKATLWE
jgi:hypothetical protein